jgi:hypothetical protein
MFIIIKNNLIPRILHIKLKSKFIYNNIFYNRYEFDIGGRRMNNKISKTLILVVIVLFLGVAFAPSLNAIQTKQTVTSIDKGGLADNVHIRVFSMSNLITFPWFGYACNLEYLHKNAEPVEYVIYMNVTKKDGTQLFETETFYENNLPPNFDTTYNYMGAKSFRDAGYPFGFFKVTIDFYVLNDGSSKHLTFHGLVFYINAMYFDTWQDWEFPGFI